MTCKKCGKALGSEIGACPFCGAMMTNEQLKIYIEDKKERSMRPVLITEKYTGKMMKIEKNTETPIEKKLVGVLVIIGILIILILLTIFIV